MGRMSDKNRTIAVEVVRKIDDDALISGTWQTAVYSKTVYFQELFAKHDMTAQNSGRAYTK